MKERAKRGPKEQQTLRDEEIRAAYKQGATANELSAWYGLSKNYIQHDICKGVRGFRNNQFTSGRFDRIANVKTVLEKYNADWEYVGGFESSEGTASIKCKKCGEVVQRSMITIRHMHCRCPECERRAREQQRAEEQARKAAEALRKEMERQAKRYSGKQETMHICKHCGVVFMGTGKYCSRECAQAVNNKRYSMKKECRRKAAWTEDSTAITVLALFKRDNGVCWLCGGLCDINADPNNNAYPSIDHVQPISKGGLDTWENVRLAHRWCNSVRSNKNVTHIAPTSKIGA